MEMELVGVTAVVTVEAATDQEVAALLTATMEVATMATDEAEEEARAALVIEVVAAASHEVDLLVEVLAVAITETVISLRLTPTSEANPSFMTSIRRCRTVTSRSRRTFTL